MEDTVKTIEMHGVARTERALGVGTRVRAARLDAGLTQGELGGARRSGTDDRLALRLRLARGWALQNLGRMDESLTELGEARLVAEQMGAIDGVALALYRSGVVRYKMGSLATAASLLDEALAA